MFDFLDSVRAQPIHVRKQIAFVTTATLSLLVASVWWHSWTGSDNVPSKKQLAEAATPSPWSVVVSTAGRAKEKTVSAFHSVTSQIAGVAQGALDSAPFGGDVEMVAAENTADTNDTEATALDTAPTQPKAESVSGEPLHTRPKVMNTTP